MLWDVVHGYRRLPGLAGGQDTFFNAVAFSPDGNTLAAAGDNGKVVLWDVVHDYRRLPALAFGELPALAFGEDTSVYGVAFSPDGKTLAAGGLDSKVVLWDAAHDYTKLPALDSGTYAVHDIAFSPDGKTLAAAGEDGAVVLWDVAHEFAKRTLASSHGYVYGVAFSPDGKTLAAAGDQGDVVLWDAAHDYTKLPPLVSGRGTVGRAVAFSPDGNTLAAAGYDSKVQLWDTFWTTFADLRAKVCDRAHGNFAEDEWETVVPGLPYSTTCPD